MSRPRKQDALTKIMSLTAIVREVLPSGLHGRILLVKADSALGIYEAVVRKYTCQSIEVVSPITSKKGIEAFELLTDLKLSKMDSFLIDIGELLMPADKSSAT